jgi:hypothetical protein
MTPSDFPAFVRGMIAAAIMRAFTPPPDKPIFEWADENVWLYSEDAAEPGQYRSVKTVWTRRLQEIYRKPFMWCWDWTAGKWRKIRVTEVDCQKSTQSGFTEAILNVIRWLVSFVARNVIYLVDSQDQGKKIARRLLRSLTRLDPGIFSGDPDDIKALEFILRGMEIIFGGSFSGTTTAQKQAPVVVSDEIEEHKLPAGDDTSATRNLKYRKKTSAGGMQFNLGKPKLNGGPIDRLFRRGDQEEFHVACPHCHYLQPVIPAMQKSCSENTDLDSPFSDRFQIIQVETEQVIAEISALELGQSKSLRGLASTIEGFNDSANYVALPLPLPLGQTRKIRTGKLVYKHCRDLLGGWDMMRVLHDTYFECGNCKQRIEESEKHRLALEACDRFDIVAPDSAPSLTGQSTLAAPMLGWLPTALGSPGVVSQHMGDMLSLNEESAWGEIARQIIDAKAEGRSELQGVINNIFGNTWREELTQTAHDDIRANVAGKDYYFLDVQTDRGTKREVFDSEAVAQQTRDIILAGGNDCGAVLPSFCKPYKRGNIPFQPAALILGSDVGGNYARWVLTAACANLIDAAVIDWGDELGSEDIAQIVLDQTWPCLDDGKRRRISYGFIDSHWDTARVLKSCWHVFQQRRGHILIPVAMIGGAAARGQRVWSYEPIATYRGVHYQNKTFKKLGYNFKEAMNDVFITCIQRKIRRIWYPAELGRPDRDLTSEERQFIEEQCNDRLIEDKHGRKLWQDPPPGPNHYGSALKNAITGLRFLTRKHHLTRDVPATEPAAAETAEATL